MPVEIWIGAAMFGALLLLLAIGIPVAFSLLTVALGSLFILEGGISAFSLVAPTLNSSVMEFALTAVPLFILMGAIISASGMGGRGGASTITLELTPEQAKKLIQATAGGSNPITLLLRPEDPGELGGALFVEE